MWMIAGPLLLLASVPPSATAAEAAAGLAQRLGEFHSPGPIAASLTLELRLERTVRHQTAKAEASLRVGVEESEAGLRTTWEPSVLRDTDAEERARDQSSDRLTPLRDAMKDLDPARLAHLLDQADTLVGLTRAAPVEEGPDTRDGREVRRLVYRFEPRLSWTEAYYLRQSAGRFTVWVASDGTPLASESIATFEGKTSRMFGRFKGTTTVHTRYVAAGARLSVAEREVDDSRSREDGGEVDHTWERFVIERK